MVPIIEQDSILLLGYSISYKEYNLTRFNHQKTLLKCPSRDLGGRLSTLWFVCWVVLVFRMP